MKKKDNCFNSSIEEKFMELKISSLTFQSGGVYMTKDYNVLFPGRKKIEDKHRMVVVIGNKTDLNDPMLPIVTCAPITTVMDETTQCLPIRAGDGNLDKDSLIKAGMVQPILKTQISHQIGTLEPETVEQLKATIFINFGLDEDSSK